MILAIKEKKLAKNIRKNEKKLSKKNMEIFCNKFMWQERILKQELTSIFKDSSVKTQQSCHQQISKPAW